MHDEDAAAVLDHHLVHVLQDLGALRLVERRLHLVGEGIDLLVLVPAEFVFFLGLISVNLAVINFLPIPVLDGGHMVFLLYEKIRGKPASEGVRVGATYAGLALILCLMVFVLYLDISRLFL